MPCRGTGSVVSNKGAIAATVECPWCKGTGMRIPGHDAQAHWGGEDGSPVAADAAGPEGGRPEGDPPDDAA